VIFCSFSRLWSDLFRILDQKNLIYFIKSARSINEAIQKQQQR
jgi:hypothetical protein